MDFVWKNLPFDSVLTIIEQGIKRPLTNLCLARNSYINRVYEIETKDTHERLITTHRPSMEVGQLQISAASAIETGQ